MTTIDKIRDLLKFSTERKFYAEARLDDGRLVVTEAESMAIGAEVFIMTDEGAAEPIADGEYTLEDGTKLAVTEGRISQLGEEEAPAAEEELEEDKDEMGDMRKKLTEVGLEDDMLEKVIEVVKAMYPKEDMSEDKPEVDNDAQEQLSAVIEAGFGETAKAIKTLMSRVEALEDKPGAEGVKHTPAPAKKTVKTDHSAAYMTALSHITALKQN